MDTRERLVKQNPLRTTPHPHPTTHTSQGWPQPRSHLLNITQFLKVSFKRSRQVFHLERAGGQCFTNISCLLLNCYTKIIEGNLSAFIYSLFHDDFSSIVRINPVDLKKQKNNKKKKIIQNMWYYRNFAKAGLNLSQYIVATQESIKSR